MSRQHADVPSPDVAEFIGFAAQFKLGRFESAGASALHTLPFGLNLEAQGIGVSSAEVCWLHHNSLGHFCGSVGAQSTAYALAYRPSVTYNKGPIFVLVKLKIMNCVVDCIDNAEV